MPFMPFQVLGMWFRGLLSIAILAGGIYLMKRWYDESWVVEADRPVVAVDEKADRPVEGRGATRPAAVTRRVFRYEPGWNRATAMLAAAVALLAWATAGRLIGQGVSLLTLRGGSDEARRAPVAAANAYEPAEIQETGPRASKKVRRERSKREKAGRVKASEAARLAPTLTSIPLDEADIDPKAERTGEVHLIRRPDGSELRVECYGPPSAPPIVFTHGWGANSTEWFYPKRYLADRFRLILWDEPGLGLSKKPDNNDYRLENLAADLDAVIGLAGGRPVVLVGHSIGGMITLTYCKTFPKSIGTRVAGLVLAHTSYTNPVRTTKTAWLYTAIEKPVLIPLMHLTIATWPLVWLMNWMSYVNGSAHRSTHSSSFSGNETRGQLDFVARFMPHGRPDVLARGMLGMIAYDATAALGSIKVPTLVFVGDQDTTTLPEAGHYIRDHVPRARLETLAPAKHMGLVEHHGRFDELVAAFAESCQGVGAPR